MSVLNRGLKGGVTDEEEWEYNSSEKEKKPIYGFAAGKKTLLDIS